MIVLDEVLGREVFNFSRQVKMKPEINDGHKIKVDTSIDLWFRNDKINEETSTRKKVETELNAIHFNNHFRDQMGEVERGSLPQVVEPETL